MATLVLLIALAGLVIGVGGMLYEGGKTVWSLKSFTRWAVITGIGLAALIGYVKISGTSPETATLEQQVAEDSRKSAEGIYQWILGLFLRESPAVPVVPATVPPAPSSGSALPSVPGSIKYTSAPSAPGSAPAPGSSGVSYYRGIPLDPATATRAVYTTARR